MNLRRRERIVMSSAVALGVAGLSLLASGVGQVATVAAPPVKSVRPLPLSSGHVLKHTFSFPPDTTFCRTVLGVSCYRPAQIQQAYDLGPLLAQGLDGRGQTIVIVDSFGSPTIAADLRHFDQTFGLPDPPAFTVIEPAGAVPPYPIDPFGAADRSSWAAETTLDVEWAHVMAPGANIALVATPTSETEGAQGFPEIVAAERYVVDHHLGSVISQSFGATEETFPPGSIRSLRSTFVAAQQNNVTVLAASGDFGATDALANTRCCFARPVNSWPAADPLVTSVGGTQLHLDRSGNRLAADNVWNDIAVFGVGGGAGGGGPSHVFARPSFQDQVRSVVGAARGTPDISMSAALDGAAVFYYSFCDYNVTPVICGPQWNLVAGTSEASPLFAGVVAIADQAAGHPLGWLNPALYAHAGTDASRGVVDVTSGTNTYVFCAANCGSPAEVDRRVTGFAARPGYDMASGLGTIDAAKFVATVAHG